MRRINHRAALEQEALNPDATDPATVVTAGLPEQFDDLPDFTAEIDEICTLSEQTEAAGDVVSSLDEVAETLSGPEEDVSAAAVKLGQVATEHLFASVGYAIVLEDNESGKSLAGKIVDGAKKIWEKIIAAITKARDWLMAFFRKLFDRSAALEKAGREYAAETDQREGVPRKGSFKNGLLAYHLQIAGQVPKKLSAAANATNAILSNQLKRLDASTAEGKQMAKVLVETPEKFSVSNKERRAASGLRETGQMSGEFGLKTRVAMSPQLLGGKIVIEKLGLDFGALSSLGDNSKYAGKAAIDRMIETPHLFAANVGPLQRVDMLKMHSQELTVGDLAELKLCASIAADMAGEVKAFRATVTKLEGVCRDFANECKRLIAESGNRNAYEERKKGEGLLDLRAVQRAFFSAAPRMFVKEPAEFASEMLTTTRALLAYVKTSTKLYARKATATAKDPFGNDPKDPFNTNVALPAPGAA